MTLGEIIEHLERLREEGAPDDALVLMAHQPNWPLQVAIREPVYVDEDEAIEEIEATIRDEDLTEEEKDEARAEIDRLRARPGIVYIVESWLGPRDSSGEELSPYAPRSLWE